MEEVEVGLTGEVEVGWVDGLTGGNAFWGEQAIATAEIALEEVNQYLDDIDAGWTMKLVVEDSETKPDIALEKLKSLHARGITIVTGWGTSGDTKGSMPYADANKILLISYGATSMALAIKDDYTYRLMPTDLAQGKCIARLAVEQGIEYLIPVWRADSWGDSVEEATNTAFTKLGGQVDEGIRYDVAAIEFGAEAFAFNDIVQDAIEKYGADKVGWYPICFEEAKLFYEALAAYDPLDWGIKWIGSDGPVLVDWVVETPIVAELFSESGCILPSKIPTPSGKLLEVQEMTKAKIGRYADLYGLNGYDAVWITALALLGADKYDPDIVKAALPHVYETYPGVAGWCPMDEYGDRAGRNFGLYEVAEIEGVYKWVKVGEYDFGTEAITYLPEPEVVF